MGGAGILGTGHGEHTSPAVLGYTPTHPDLHRADTPRADRKKTLEQNQAAKIKKRNDNLATKQSRGKKTPGAKGKSSGDSKGKGGSSSGGGKKGRPGFEGKSKSGKSSGGGDKKKRAQMKA